MQQQFTAYRYDVDIPPGEQASMSYRWYIGPVYEPIELRLEVILMIGVEVPDTRGHENGRGARTMDGRGARTVGGYGARTENGHGARTVYGRACGEGGFWETVWSRLCSKFLILGSRV